MSYIIDILRNNPNQINAIAAICAVIVSFLSILLTVWTLRQQRKHNFLSLAPIASIPISDYEDDIAVNIKNTGVGPLIVQTFRVTDGKTEKDNVISWMPTLPGNLCWSTFYDCLDGLCIPPGEGVILLRLKGDASNKTFQEARDKIRKALSTLIVTLKYKDIYNRKMTPKRQDLSWFGRHFR
jgi:hypothetical protein